MGPPLLLSLLLLSIPSTSAFVFSCQEVKDDLINSFRLEQTEYVCLVPEEGYTNVESLKTIYAQNDKISVPFNEILNAEGLCVERATENGFWQIAADPPITLDCNQQIALIFTSTLPNFIRVDQKSTSFTIDSDRVMVSPRSGLKIHSIGCQGNGNITVFTGAGKGVNEFRYELESWRCSEVPDWIVSFENVITMTVDAGVKYSFDISSDYKSTTTLNPRERVSILTSGKSDNLQNTHPYENYATFRMDYLVDVQVKENLFFDGEYGGYIQFAYGTNNDATSTRVDNQNNSNIGFSFNATNFSVSYLTTQPVPVWDDQDNFIIDISLGDSILPPSTTTPKPAPVGPGEVDPNGYCGCGMDMENYDTDGSWQLTDIWLDLIFILDVSEGMADAVKEASGLVELIVSNLETNPSAPFYTRVGVITMADVVTVKYDLNMGSDDSLGDVAVAKGVYKYDMTAAFKAALDMFSRGMATNRVDRQHSRQAIYYITNTDPDEIDDGVKQFKLSGGKIIVSDFTEKGQTADPKLREIASDGYYSTDLKNYLNTYPLLCDVNCFCYKKDAYNPDDNERVDSKGGCYKVDQSGFTYDKAQQQCPKTQNGKLAAPHDKNKEYYLMSLISESFGPKQQFWIGYKSDGSKWTFEDNSSNPFTDFASGENIHNGVQYAYQVQTTGFNSTWHAGNGKAPYPSVCEMAPCSVGYAKCNVD